jgi:P-type Ca2+ transporter type 2C
LSIAAVISLALGFYQTFRPGAPATDKVDWVEGVAILVAIAIVTVVQSVNDYQKERQFMKLNQKVSSLKSPG